MLLAPAQLDQHLARGLAGLYVVHGDEPLLTLETADRIRAAARAAGAVERQVLQMDARSDWSQLTTQSASLSLFAEKRLMEIRLPTGKPGTSGAQALARFARGLQEHPDDSQIALVLLPKLDKTGKSSEWFTALVSAGVAIEVPTIERDALPRWIGERMARHQQRASREVLEFIADRVEGNLLAAHQEIEKLALIEPPGELSMETVQASVLNVARYGVQQLSEALLGGDIARAQRIADGLRAEGEGLPLVVWFVAEDARTLLKYKTFTAAGRPPATFKNELRLWGPREGAVGQAARRVTLAAMRQALVGLEQVDRLSKGLTHGTGKLDPWEAMSRLFPLFGSAAPAR
ncbi:hypothetical protein IP84_10850 [beta proteobacterium AAP99]|nr:hypothetical protein IP84_10850 [beta proteobacterium AAP99]